MCHSNFCLWHIFLDVCPYSTQLHSPTHLSIRSLNIPAYWSTIFSALSFSVATEVGTMCGQALSTPWGMLISSTESAASHIYCARNLALQRLLMIISVRDMLCFDCAPCLPTHLLLRCKQMQGPCKITKHVSGPCILTLASHTCTHSQLLVAHQQLSSAHWCMQCRFQGAT